MIGLSIAAAFLLGLASTVHCWAMCGGIIGALSLGVTSDSRVTPLRRALLVAGFSAGRILSYGVAGAVVGAAGGLVVAGRAEAYVLLQLAAAAVLVLVGLHLAGWFPGIGALEAAGSRLWRRLQPAGRHFLPVNGLSDALIIGALWGWLPCGLVYSALLWTSAHADPVFGAAAMIAFGLGTLPGMSVAGLTAQRLSALPRRPGLRRAVGVLIIVLGVASGFAAVGGAMPDTSTADHIHA